MATPTETETPGLLGSPLEPTGARMKRLLGAVPTWVLWLVCILWTIPTIGLLVSSFRPVEDINNSGWWTALWRPDFTLDNPNRARSVYSAFGNANHRRLHALDGSGYAYLADAVSRLDGLNPQLAARVATPLTRWQRYDEKRQGLMRASLEQLVSKEEISKDLFEIVTKSLQDGQ